jgi:hypothetical protein
MPNPIHDTPEHRAFEAAVAAHDAAVRRYDYMIRTKADRVSQQFAARAVTTAYARLENARNANNELIQAVMVTMRASQRLKVAA